MEILVATDEGLHAFEVDGRPGIVDHAGRPVTSLARSGNDVWAILDGAEIWLAAGADPPWVHIADIEGYRANCLVNADGTIFVGASEARLFRLDGDRLEPVASFDEVAGRDAWHTPWGGPPDVRSFSEWDADVYVNVHVGGILRTDDGGATWTPTIEIDADVHQVATAAGLVLAACARGLVTSRDRGATWTIRTEGLEARYSRAVAVCGDVVLVSASRGPRGGRSGLYRAPLTGGAFERCRDGLPEWFDDNIDTYCVDALPDGPHAAFGTSDGRVYASTDAGASWTPLASDLSAVHHMLVLP